MTSPKTNRILWHRMVTYKIPSVISRVFSTNLPWLLAVTFHISSVHKLYNQWWMACRFTLTQRVLTEGVKFPYPLSTWHLIHSLASRYGYQSNIRRKMFTFQIISMIKRYPQKYVHGSDCIHDQDIQKVHVLPKLTADDRTSSKTHLVRFMHNVVTSKFKIFSVAKARCWNTRLSPKTPKVFPVLSSSSKI